tara:strand:+ start:5688 stop:5981 length:294 start_codon:yes stop_codon:yes gene_type:complete
MSEAFNAGALDDVIHGKFRLGMMAYLSAVDSATFSELKTRLDASDGNLSVQLRKLETAGYVTVEKRFVDRKPQTTARLTEAGRAAWIEYLDQLRSLL